MKNADRINLYAGLPQAAVPPTALAVSNDVANSIAAKPSPKPSAAEPAIDIALRETAELRDHLASQPAKAGDANTRQLQRLLSQLKTTRQEQLEDSPEIGNRQRRLKLRRRTRLIRLALAVALAVIVLQGGAFWWLYRQAETMLGRPLTPTALVTATSDDLSVSFRTDANATAIATLLQGLRLRVVDGPLADGSYVLRPESGGDSVKDLNALRDHRNLVYSAAAAD
ncbi:MAG: hypothetical protein ABWY00_16565 [Dongiaceae bacterium]